MKVSKERGSCIAFYLGGGGGGAYTSIDPMIFGLDFGPSLRQSSSKDHNAKMCQYIIRN